MQTLARSAILLKIPVTVVVLHYFERGAPEHSGTFANHTQARHSGMGGANLQAALANVNKDMCGANADATMDSLLYL